MNLAKEHMTADKEAVSSISNSGQSDITFYISGKQLGHATLE